MRWLTEPRPRDDSGVSLILVAFLIVALVGMAALVIDVGAMVQERRTLQNGADAAALAVAVDCAKGDCGPATGTANTYADLNADDGMANIDEVCGDGPGIPGCASPPAGASARYVKVGTSTDSGGSTIVRFLFGPALGLSGKTVRRSATAAWGTPGSTTTLPIVISTCEFEKAVGTPAQLPSDEVYLYFHDTAEAGTCPNTTGPAGSDDPISGGFGWLDSTGCSATIDANNWVDDKPGVAIPNGCDFTLLRGKTVAVPFYDGTNGLTGANGSYHVAGFGAFTITGYRFPSETWGMDRCPLGSGASSHCIRGTFERLVGNGEDLGGGTDYGYYIVKLVG